VVVPPDGLDGVLDGVLEQLVNLSLTLSLAFVLLVLLVLLVPFRFDPLVAVSDLLLDNGFPPPTAFVVVLVVVSESVETDTCVVLERVDGIVNDRDTVEREK
jgi:hypothetical protein